MIDAQLGCQSFHPTLQHTVLGGMQPIRYMCFRTVHYVLIVNTVTYPLHHQENRSDISDTTQHDPDPYPLYSPRPLYKHRQPGVSDFGGLRALLPQEPKARGSHGHDRGCHRAN